MYTNSITPPQSEQELLDRARQLAGLTLAQLAERMHFPLRDPHRAKGWVGQLLEKSLGATAGSLAEPDFQHIGVELKTLPLNQHGKPKESTYVCTVPLLRSGQMDWETSWVRNKLHRVLWLPLEADTSLSLGERHIGNALLWSPDRAQEQVLRQDWEELMEMVCTGQIDQVTSHMGNYLQIRPKGANARSLVQGFDAEGQPVKTLPRGFYLRTCFTQQILDQFY